VQVQQMLFRTYGPAVGALETGRHAGRPYQHHTMSQTPNRSRENRYRTTGSIR
jgi:hypothetical protein